MPVVRLGVFTPPPAATDETVPGEYDERRDVRVFLGTAVVKGAALMARTQTITKRAAETTDTD